ncbi:hypothetical protein N6G95_09380 [Pediococcus inopinatus]|uniref:hypothetical protein n=1 Tax=Pediococcus inopinatus TaxID=114090 RepID=UPI002B260256|nr:hypothetical protein [Pediococcus inopinatus]WPC19416.1 hypothetical protein N6G95_09380 [Pediococcus inopinatus]
MSNQIIAEASIDVNEAPRQAEKAQNTADNAASGVTNLNDPNLMSVIEKQTQAAQYAGLTSQYNVLIRNAKDDGIDTVSVTTAYNNLNKFMANVLADPDHASDVDRVTYKKYQDAYNEELANLQNALQNNANNKFASATNAASQAATTASQAFSAADGAFSQAQLIGSQADSAIAVQSQATAKAQSTADNAFSQAQTIGSQASSEIAIQSTATAKAQSAADNAFNKAQLIGSQANAGISSNSMATAKAQSTADNALANAKSAVSKAESTASDFGKVSQKTDDAFDNAMSAQNAASSAVATANSTASEFGKVSQKTDSAVASALNAQNAASDAVQQASSAAADSKDAKQIAGAVSQSYKTLTDGSTMTIAELQSGLAVKLTKTDLDGYATQTWTQNQVKMTADGINGTLSSIKGTVDGQTTDINDLQADSHDFKSQFTTVNGALNTQSTDIGTLQASSKELSSNFSSLNTDNGTNKNDISELKQTADGLKSDISKKIEQKDLNGYATETWAQNQIKVTADGINGTMSSIKTTVDGQTTDINDLKADSSSFKSQFTTVNDTLGKQTTDIGTLQATSKELTSGFNTLTSDNTTNKNDISQLKQTATEVSSTLETVKTQVQDSAVGANLIIQSDLKNGYLNGDTGSAVGSNIDFYSDSYIATNGETVFTFSSPDYVFKGNGAADRIVMYDSDKNYLGYQSLTSPTLTLSNSNVAYIRFSINSAEEGNTTGNLSDWLANHRYKLEKGSVATDYSVNPADTATQSQITQLSGEIEQKVNSGDFSTYKTQTANLIAEKVSNGDFSTYKTQTADLISQKVATKDFSAYQATTDKSIESKVESSDFTTYKSQTADAISAKVATKDFAAYQETTAKAISSKVETSDFNTYKSQTADAISAKVATKDFSTYTTQTANDINLRVTKGDLIDQINIQVGNTLISSSGQLTLSGKNIYFDTDNPVIIPSANIETVLVNKKLEAADISANTFSTNNETFTVDKDGAITAKNMTIIGGTLNTPTLNLGDGGTLTASYSVADSTSYFQPINGTGTLKVRNGYIQSTANLLYYNKLLTTVADSWGYWKNSTTFIPETNMTVSNTAESTLTPAFLKLDIFDQAKANVVSRSYIDGTGLYINNGETQTVGSVLTNFELMSAGMAYLNGGVNVPKSQLLTIGNIQIGGYHTIASNNGGDIYFQKTTTAGSASVGLNAKSFTKASRLSIKSDISDLSADDATRMLNGIDIERYRYTTDGATYKYQYGAIIDDQNELGERQYALPNELLNEENTGINMDSMIGILIKTVQSQSKQIGELSMRLTRLETA